MQLGFSIEHWLEPEPTMWFPWNPSNSQVLMLRFDIYKKKKKTQSVMYVAHVACQGENLATLEKVVSLSHNDKRLTAKGTTGKKIISCKGGCMTNMITHSRGWGIEFTECPVFDMLHRTSSGSSSSSKPTSALVHKESDKFQDLGSSTYMKIPSLCIFYLFFFKKTFINPMMGKFASLTC